MGKVGFWSLVIGLGVGYFAYKEGEIAFRSTKTPEEITLAKLIERGPKGNAHVVVTDFLLCKNLVHQVEKDKPNVWTRVWIPIVPTAQAAAQGLSPENVQALFFSTQITNDRDLDSRLDKPKVQALITNTIDSLSEEVRKHLKDSYSKTDFDKCLILQEGREPRSAGLVIGMGVGAGFAILLGITLLLFSWLRPAKTQPEA